MYLSVRKNSGTVKRGVGIVIVVITLLTVVSCSAPEGDELEDAGPLMSFWVELVISDPIIATEYKPTRVLAWDEKNKRQIGQTSAYEQNRYKITLPVSYSLNNVAYITEFFRTESKFDGNHYTFSDEAVKPLVVGLLKSRYYEIAGSIPNSNQAEVPTVKLCIYDVEKLNLGFGPGSSSLEDIPKAPHVYLINLDTDINADEDYGLTVMHGIAMAEGSSPTATEDPTGLGFGFASVETDWILLLAPQYDPGSPLTFCFTIRRDPNAALCPCAASCDCGCPDETCPYITDASPLLIPVIKSVSGSEVSGGTGSSITIELRREDIPCPQIP